MNLSHSFRLIGSLALLSGSILSWPLHSLGESMGLTEYKDLVHKNSPGWQAAQADAKGGELLTSEAESLTSIQLISQSSFLKDERITVNPSFQGTKTENTSANIGFRQQTDWGLTWSLTHNWSHTHIFNAPILSIPEFYEAFPKLELSIPLWKNFLGAEVSAQKNQLSQTALARKKQGELALIKAEIETETTYFSLLALQQLLDTQKDSLARAERVLQWTRSRIQKNLADASDIFQSQAAVAARKIELETTQKNLAEALSKFKARIGMTENSNAVSIREEPLPKEALQLALQPQRRRRDLELQRLAASANSASFKTQKEKYKPSLDLSIVALKQGRDESFQAAEAMVFDANNNYSMIALNFAMPLNQIRQGEFREGYEQLSQGQFKLTEELQRTGQVSWESTVNQGKQLSNQLTLAQELETLQKKKADAERDKFNRGRSTLFQVLLYEQDYLGARIQRINLELTARQFISQLATFE